AVAKPAFVQPQTIAPITIRICTRPSGVGRTFRAPQCYGVKSRSRIMMGRRYRRRNSLGSVVTDVVRVAARLPWWGALLVGFLAYLVISIGLGGYLEGKLAAQEGSQFYPVLQARFGRLIRLTDWVGYASLVVGAFFAIRNHFFGEIG